MKVERLLLFGSILCLTFGPSDGRGQFVWQTESSVGFTPRSALTSADVNGKVYAIGGDSDDTNGTALNTLEVFDPSTNTWATPVTTGTFTPRGGLISAVVDGKIYVMGGYGPTDLVSQSNTLNTLEVFDPSTNTWTTPATTGDFTPRWGLVSAVIDGKIYVMFGNDGNTEVNTMEVFDPSTNTWSTPITTGVHSPKRDPACAVVGGKIYVIGGIYGFYLDTLEVFDPSTNTWSRPATTGTFTPRVGLSCAVADGKIYVMGGGNYQTSWLNTLEVFDPSTSSWSTPATTGTLTRRSYLTSAYVGGAIYAMGGTSSTGLENINEALILGDNSVAEGSSTHAIFSCYPNPITDRAIISFDLPERADVRVDIHDDLGRLVSTLVNEEMPAGLHQLTWNPNPNGAGIYICTLNSVSLNLAEHSKLLLMR